MKKLRLTAHAAHAAAERGVMTEWIERAAREPQWVLSDPHDEEVERRFVAIPEFGGRVLRAACVENATEILVVTVFFDRGAKRPS